MTNKRKDFEEVYTRENEKQDDTRFSVFNIYDHHDDFRKKKFVEMIENGLIEQWCLHNQNWCFLRRPNKTILMMYGFDTSQMKKIWFFLTQVFFECQYQAPPYINLTNLVKKWK